MKQSSIFKPSTSRKSAFTLIELLVVIAIIAILAAILFPVFARARENARRSSCQSNMKQMGLGLAQYTQDYDEKFPAYARQLPGNGNTQWQSAVQPYLKSTQLFKCPSNTSTSIAEGSGIITPGGFVTNYVGNIVGVGADPWTSPNNGTGMFGGSNSPGISLAEVPSSATTIHVIEATSDMVCIDSGGNCAGFSPDRLFNGHLATANYLFADGHVKSLKPMATIANGVNMWTRDNATAVSADLQNHLNRAVQNAR